ncbi:hypothetical protein A2344_02805 [Candidatus Peregrinibacteria bacterium RIFOXYB12_FULL_41_12]|nr:MAG: hypothetical protein A2244_05245 [Candidatus Peregrinibacteria bacterium RIFOXYA2_FULL_41_18]OGJ48920.1 MAG: hypothetical protein A2344_02805 [Candidatus Peregrinibacteria bacterium RIFOXYB12_FULL_41_12]
MEQTPTEDMDVSKETDTRYIGMWMRQGSYVNGELVSAEPASLEMKDKSYEAFTVLCSTTGELVAEGNALTMKVASSNCPGPVTDYIVYTYDISEDGTLLTITAIYAGQEVKELYERTEQK